MEAKIKVLFVSSGNSIEGISPIVKMQGESLRKQNIHIDYYTIVGKGFSGYIRNIFRLKRYLSQNSYNLIHAHYSLSAIVASFATRKPIIVSLMGSDAYMKWYWIVIIKILKRIKWAETIVKSKSMNEIIKNSRIIPNGVDFSKFKPIDKSFAKKELGFDDSQKYIIFVSNPARNEKNFQLAQKAIHMLNERNIILKVVYDVDHSSIPKYMNAANVLLLTSLREGSPNVIKEAMACNCPIVSTDVGDVSEIISKTEGCFISSFEPGEFAYKLNRALE